MGIIKQHRAAHAFTLVELLVVVAIIVTLIAVLLPALHKARMSAQQIQCASNVRQLVLAMLTYANDYNQCLPGPNVKSWNGPTYVARNGYRGGSGVPPYDLTGLTNPDPDYGWGIMSRFRYVTSATLLGCPARMFTSIQAGVITSGPYSAIETTYTSQYVHYCYRYNGSAQLTYTSAVSPSYGTIYGSNFKSDLHSLTRRGFSQQALIYENPGYGLNFGAASTNTALLLAEAQAMEPNPNNWPHVSGGNVALGDGSVSYVLNARFGTGNSSIGWPIATGTDQTYPETTGSASAPVVASVPALLDTLVVH